MSLALLFLKERRFLCGLAHSMAYIRDWAQSFPVCLLWHQESVLVFHRGHRRKSIGWRGQETGFSNGSANG